MGNNEGKTYKACGEVSLKCDARKAWSLLRDLAIADKYVPGVESVEMINDLKGEGASRKVLPAGLTETVVEWREGDGIVLALTKDGEKGFFPFIQASFAYNIIEKQGKTFMELCLEYSPVMGKTGQLIFGKAINMRIQKTAESLGKFYNSQI